MNALTIWPHSESAWRISVPTLSTYHTCFDFWMYSTGIRASVAQWVCRSRHHAQSKTQHDFKTETVINSTQRGQPNNKPTIGGWLESQPSSFGVMTIDDWGMVYSIIYIYISGLPTLMESLLELPSSQDTEIDWAKSHGFRWKKNPLNPSIELSFPSFSHDILILSPFYSHSR